MNPWPNNPWGADPAWAPGGPDWLWWGSAVVLGLFAAWLFYRAMIRDPGRGTRRCPKCWYDMGGIEGRICPECGQQARCERALFRRRRGYWRGFVSLGMMVVAAGVSLMPRVRLLGAASLLPDTIISRVLLTTREEGFRNGWASFHPRGSFSSATHIEFARRVDSGGFSDARLRSMIRRSGMFDPSPVGVYLRRDDDGGFEWEGPPGITWAVPPISPEVRGVFTLESDVFVDLVGHPHWGDPNWKNNIAEFLKHGGLDRPCEIWAAFPSCATGAPGPFVFRGSIPERILVTGWVRGNAERRDLGSFWVPIAVRNE